MKKPAPTRITIPRRPQPTPIPILAPVFNPLVVAEFDCASELFGGGVRSLGPSEPVVEVGFDDFGMVVKEDVNPSVMPHEFGKDEDSMTSVVEDSRTSVVEDSRISVVEDSRISVGAEESPLAVGISPDFPLSNPEPPEEAGATDLDADVLIHARKEKEIEIRKEEEAKKNGRRTMMNAYSLLLLASTASRSCFPRSHLVFRRCRTPVEGRPQVSMR
jgi:hypothetical protein